MCTVGTGGSCCTSCNGCPTDAGMVVVVRQCSRPMDSAHSADLGAFGTMRPAQCSVHNFDSSGLAAAASAAFAAAAAVPLGG